MTSKYKYQDITQRIIAAAFEVHNYLGKSFPEVIYQKDLAIEMQKKNLNYKREMKIQIFYKDFPKPIGSRRVGFMVEDKVLIELKVTPKSNYLKIYKIEMGLLINFGSNELSFNRVEHVRIL